MNKYKTSPVSNPRILRNGKIVNPKNKTLIKKKMILKTNNDNQLTFLKTSPSDLNNLQIKKKKKSHKIMLTNYKQLKNRCNVLILLDKLPPSIMNRVNLDDQNCKDSNTNCYKNLEDYIALNEVQIYDIEPKVERKIDFISTNKTKQTSIPPNLSEKTSLHIKTYDHSVSNENTQNTCVRLTRGKTIELQTAERKQLDQLMVDKFPNIKFKKFEIQLIDIMKEVKFLRTLGLACRFKCSFSNNKKKKKN